MLEEGVKDAINQHPKSQGGQPQHAKNQPPRRIHINTRVNVEAGGHDIASKCISSIKNEGLQSKQTNMQLHNMIFSSGKLYKDKVFYCIKKESVLEGRIMRNGIYCCCCRNVISPTKFEDHAGQGSWRKPYHHIYTLNGVSLDKFAANFSNEQKLNSGSDLKAQQPPSGVSDSDDLDVISCVLCRKPEFSKSNFNEFTTVICEQCEKEFHIGCLKFHKISVLEELPDGSWFCSNECNNIHASLSKRLHHTSKILYVDMNNILQKFHKNGLDINHGLDISWRLLKGGSINKENKLLQETISILKENFKSITDIWENKELIPLMVNGERTEQQDFFGVYCPVLTIGSSVVSAAILRVLGCKVAELPLAATTTKMQEQGCFRALFSCIENMLSSMNVKHLVLPAAPEAESFWINKFQFEKITVRQLQEYDKDVRLTFFDGTSMLHKSIPSSDDPLSTEDDAALA